MKLGLLIPLVAGGLSFGAQAESAIQGSSASVSQSGIHLPSGPSALAAKYLKLQSDLLSRGRLRTDAGAPDAPWNQRDVIDNFVQIAMFSEYDGRGGGFSASKTGGVLRRWVDPVRVRVLFGSGVPADQRKSDARQVSGLAKHLSRVTGHPVMMTQKGANVHVLIVSDAERRGLGPLLSSIAPDLSRAGRRAFLKMPPNILCMVLAQPHRNAEQGYRTAIALVRAEHPPQMRASCIQEELAQAMGLPNDSPQARPSIFNDNEEFGVLTHHDEVLLRVLYDTRLRPGMTLKEVHPLLPQVTKTAMSRR